MVSVCDSCGIMHTSEPIPSSPRQLPTAGISELLSSMNTFKGASKSPELWSPAHPQSTFLTSAAPPFALSQQATDTALNAILTVVIIMVSLGCTTEIAKITMHLRKPKGIAIAVVSQYGIMPLTAFTLGKLFQLDPTVPGHPHLQLLLRGKPLKCLQSGTEQ